MTINHPSITEEQFVEKYLEFYNLMVPEEQQLVDSEISLVKEFILLPDDKFSYQRFGGLAKTKVVESAASKGWKLTKLNINNKLYALIEKGFLKRDEDSVIYLPKHILSAAKEFRTSKKFSIHVNFTNGSK